MVWEEETAGRPEPQSSKRGKKRKSDQISQRPTTTTTDDFPDIMDLLTDDESLRTPVKQSPTKSPARSKLKTSPNKSPSKGTAVTKTPSKQRINLAYDDTSINPSRIKVSPFKTPKRGSTLGKSEFSDSKLASLLSDSDSLFGSDVERVPKCEAKTPRRRGKDERVIQDSDDEILTPSAYKVTESAIPRSGSPSKRYHNSQHQHHNSAQGTPSRTRGLISSQTVTVVRSPQKRERRKLSESEPVKSPDEARADNPASSQTDVHHSDEKMSAMLRLFLCRPSIMEMKRISLEEGLRQNRESFKKSLQEGSFEPREHLRRDKERLIKQQAALDVLSNEYRSYEDLVAKRDALIARIYDAYGHDLNTEDDETHLQGLDILLKARQDSLKTHLLNAGIKDPTEYEDQTVHNLNTNRSESIVQATQATQPIARSNWLRESTQVSGMGSAQVIMQTQVPARPDTQRQTIYSSLDRGEQCSVAVRGNEPVTSIPHPAADMMDYEGDDLFETPDFLPSRDLSKTTRVVHQSSAAKCRRSPRKATALQKRGYESDYSDDIDISELAQEIEFQRSSSELRPAKPTRSVLLETSGNVGTRREKPAAKVKQNSTAVPVSPRQKKFPWYKDVRRALKDRFRMSGFRHNQLAAINATLSGKDAFILMPTGGGKSLCYQLPAVVNSGKTKGITVVVSPLLSLMHDQVEHLKALNIAAAAFNGETPPREKKEIMDTLMDPKSDQILRLLYVTPEMINKSTTFLNGLSSLYRNKKLARLVIDEAHCVSQWGHDFRPDYKQLGSFRERFPGVPLMALTATATQNVITDVKHNLGVEECEQFTQSFNRPNLYYEVCRKEKDNTATIADLINSKYPGKTGIVYTLSRKSAENIAQKLRDQGIAAHHYHASVDSKEKVRIQRDWQRGAIKVVVATIAFGMGIDKSDVRFVIHQSVPKSLEGYYQETGRAGRDGKPSECYLYFSYGDVTQLRKLIADGDGNEEQKERQRNMLGTVTAFCDNQSDCRRVEILRYFGETFSKAQCNATCDNCKSEDQFEQKDFTKYALAVLEIVGSEGRVTLAQCTDYLMAKKKKSDYSYVVQKYHGIARSMPKHEVHRVVDRLLAEEALTEENVWMSTIRMTIQYFRVSNLLPGR
jgi:bloom syndrome protein